MRIFSSQILPDHGEIADNFQHIISERDAEQVPIVLYKTHTKRLKKCPCLENDWMNHVNECLCFFSPFVSRRNETVCHWVGMGEQNYIFHQSPGKMGIRWVPIFFGFLDISFRN